MAKKTVDEKARDMRAILKQIKELIERGVESKQTGKVHFHTVHAEVFLTLVELYPQIESAVK